MVFIETSTENGTLSGSNYVKTYILNTSYAESSRTAHIGVASAYDVVDPETDGMTNVVDALGLISSLSKSFDI